MRAIEILASEASLLMANNAILRAANEELQRENQTLKQKIAEFAKEGTDADVPKSD